MFVALNLFKTELTGPMTATQTTLPISSTEASKICAALGDECVPCDEATGTENFTRLVINHNGYNEIVKVTGCSGGVVNIERGDEGTTPRALPQGACVTFTWTMASIECAIIQVASGVPLSPFAGCGTIDLGEGVPGPQGPAGADGTDGSGMNGTDGTDGTNGVNGVDGAQGSTGPQGPQGITGSPGNQGVAGPAGPAGVAGPAGANGVNGLPGTTGADGHSAYEHYVFGGGTMTEAQFNVCLATTCP